MYLTPEVKTILGYYESDNPGTKANLARILMQGKLGGTGKLVILPVDQGFEHGPAAASRRTRPHMTRITTSSSPLTPGCRRMPLPSA